MRNLRPFLSAVFLTAIVACSRTDPGPLAGTWRLIGLVPMTIQFRSGETESMGIIEKVSYVTEGNDVLVKYENGLMKGSAVRFTLTGIDSARSELGILQRVK